MPTKAREYARNAREAAAQAARETDPDVRQLLEHMAQTWSRLAEAAGEHARQRRRIHERTTVIKP